MRESLHEQQYPMNVPFRGRSLGSDRLHSLVWAAILIWAGLVFLADNIGMFDRLIFPGASAGHIGSWPVIFLGAGLIVLLEVAVRFINPDLQSEASRRLVLAVILLGLGLGGLVGWHIIWPVLLIAVGASILMGGFLRR